MLSLSSKLAASVVAMSALSASPAAEISGLRLQAFQRLGTGDENLDPQENVQKDATRTRKRDFIPNAFRYVKQKFQDAADARQTQRALRVQRDAMRQVEQMQAERETHVRRHVNDLRKTMDRNGYDLCFLHHANLLNGESARLVQTTASKVMGDIFTSKTGVYSILAKYDASLYQSYFSSGYEFFEVMDNTLEQEFEALSRVLSQKFNDTLTEEQYDFFVLTITDPNLKNSHREANFQNWIYRHQELLSKDKVVGTVLMFSLLELEQDLKAWETKRNMKEAQRQKKLRAEQEEERRPAEAARLASMTEEQIVTKAVNALRADHLPHDRAFMSKTNYQAVKLFMKNQVERTKKFVDSKDLMIGMKSRGITAADFYKEPEELERLQKLTGVQDRDHIFKAEVNVLAHIICENLTPRQYVVFLNALAQSKDKFGMSLLRDTAVLLNSDEGLF